MLEVIPIAHGESLHNLVPRNRHRPQPRGSALQGEMWKLLQQPKLLEATMTGDTANILYDVRV